MKTQNERLNGDFNEMKAQARAEEESNKRFWDEMEEVQLDTPGFVLEGLLLPNVSNKRNIEGYVGMNLDDVLLDHKHSSDY